MFALRGSLDKNALIAVGIIAGKLRHHRECKGSFSGRHSGAEQRLYSIGGKQGVRVVRVSPA